MNAGRIFSAVSGVTLFLAAGCAFDNSSKPGSISRFSTGTMNRINALVINEHLAVFEIGKLEVNFYLPEGVDIKKTKVLLDNFYIGNLDSEKKIFTLKRGMHLLEVKAPGCAEYSRSFMLLGNPNSQVLNIFLEKGEDSPEAERRDEK
jgi:hypothetical protein